VNADDECLVWHLANSYWHNVNDADDGDDDSDSDDDDDSGGDDDSGDDDDNDSDDDDSDDDDDSGDDDDNDSGGGDDSDSGGDGDVSRLVQLCVDRLPMTSEQQSSHNTEADETDRGTAESVVTTCLLTSLRLLLNVTHDNSQ